MNGNDEIKIPHFLWFPSILFELLKQGLVVRLWTDPILTFALGKLRL